MLDLTKLYQEAARQAGLERRRQLRVGPGRQTLRTVHRVAARGKDYGVGYCGGHQERERRAKRELT